MSKPPESTRSATPPALAYSIHALTALGVIFVFLAVRELTKIAPDPRWVLVWLGVTLLIDMIDGPLARRFDVKRAAPRIDGRGLDDIIDYLTFTFVPLLMVWRMGWLPGGAVEVDGDTATAAVTAPGFFAGVLVAIAMAVSLFGFTNTQAKQEAEGFFLGFPSYWNLYAIYAGLFAGLGLAWVNAVLLMLCVVFTIVPVRFVYPNLAPKPWYWPLLLGGLAWGAVLVGMLPWYPYVPPWLVWVSLIYPVFYLVISGMLDWRVRRSRG